MADEKQISAVRFFCRSTPSNSGQFNHDWSELVQQVSYFDFGQIQKDKGMIQSVVRSVRKDFPNGETWGKIRKRPRGALRTSWPSFEVDWQPC